MGLSFDSTLLPRPDLTVDQPPNTVGHLSIVFREALKLFAHLLHNDHRARLGNSLFIDRWLIPLCFYIRIQASELFAHLFHDHHPTFLGNLWQQNIFVVFFGAEDFFALLKSQFTLLHNTQRGTHFQTKMALSKKLATPRQDIVISAN